MDDFTASMFKLNSLFWANQTKTLELVTMTAPFLSLSFVCRRYI